MSELNHTFRIKIIGKTQKKIGILGIGAIGSIIASTMHNVSSYSILYFNRSPKSEVKIEFNGRQFSFPIESKSNATGDENLDWLIISLKAYHFEDASILFESLIKSNTKVAIIRNGINLSNDLKSYTTEKNILSCMIDCPVQPQEDEYYLQMSHPIITTELSGLSEEFASLFQHSEIIINAVEDFKTASWKKLIESSALGSILCLTGQTCHIFEDPIVLQLCDQLITEGIEVAVADGAIIEQNFAATLLNKIKQYPKDKGSSMLTDRINGNKIELSAKNGAIAQMAKVYGIATPVNDLFCTLIEKINTG